MVPNKFKKVERINVQEILTYKKQVFIDDLKRASAVKELKNKLKGIAAKNAYRIKGFVSIFRSLSSPDISENLELYIKSCSNRALRKVIENQIVASYKGAYSSFSMHKNWERTKKGLFWFYYFEDEKFVDVYSLRDDELPLYVNHEFSTKEDQELFIQRLKIGRSE